MGPIILLMLLQLLKRGCLAFVALAVICLPVNGEHLHLCFDGSEPPVSLHVQLDGGGHPAGEGLQQMHHDADVTLDREAASKKGRASFDLLPLLSAAIAVRMPITTPVWVARDESAIRLATLDPNRLPPQRGPPA